MKAIHTYSVGPSTYRGTRIVVRIDGHRRTYPYNYELDSDANQDACANTYATELGWLERNTLMGGTLHDGSRCYVLVPKK